MFEPKSLKQAYNLSRLQEILKTTNQTLDHTF